MSARIRAGAAVGVVLYLYLFWLGWKDFLVAPPLPRSEPPAALAVPEGTPAGGVDAPASPTQAPPPAPVSLARSRTADSAAEAGMTLAVAPAAPPSESPRPVAATSEPVEPAEGRSPKTRLEGASDASRDPSADDPEEPPDEPRSRLRLGGWVLDREGNAVAGLPVEARTRRLFASLDAGSAAVPATELRAVTDVAGRFAFEQVPDGEYDVRTDETELYERVTAALRAGADSAVLVVETKSGRTLHVHGVVASTRGGPLKGVRVEVVGRPALAALSNESGGYGVRLPAGARDQDLALRFAREGYREQRVPIGAAEAAAGDVVRDVSLEPAEARGPVNGVVTGSDGPPVARASVQLLSTRLARRYQALSDSEGRFAFAGVEESDDYRLWVRPAKGYRDHVREGVEIGPQGASLGVVVDALGTASLRGSMVDPEGRSVPGFTLWLSSAYGAARPVAVTGDAQGRFEVGDLPEGAVTLETRAAPRLSVTGLQLAAGAAREVRIPLDIGPYRLEGSLLDERGTPVGGGRVSLLGLRADGGLSSRSFRETVSDARGHFAFTQLGSGTPTLSVTAAGFRGVRLQPAVGSMTTPLQIELLASP